MSLCHSGKLGVDNWCGLDRDDEDGGDDHDDGGDGDHDYGGDGGENSRNDEYDENDDKEAMKLSYNSMTSLTLRAVIITTVDIVCNLSILLMIIEAKMMTVMKVNITIMVVSLSIT